MGQLLFVDVQGSTSNSATQPCENQHQMQASVVVTVTDGHRTQQFRVITAGALLPEVRTAFGEGNVKDIHNITLTAEYGNLQAGTYTWTPKAGEMLGACLHQWMHDSCS